MAGPLVPNLPLHVLQQTVAASRSHEWLHIRTQSHCVGKRKHNIFFGKGNSIFTNRHNIHRTQREDGVGVRGHREELGVTGMDATASPLQNIKFKWPSFVMSAF